MGKPGQELEVDSHIYVQELTETDVHTPRVQRPNYAHTIQDLGNDAAHHPDSPLQTDVPTSQPNGDSPSKEFSSRVIVDCVKLTIKTIRLTVHLLAFQPLGTQHLVT